MKPMQQMIKVFQMNCNNAMFEKRSSMLSDKSIILWCLLIKSLITAREDFDVYFLEEISTKPCRIISIWPLTCST